MTNPITEGRLQLTFAAGWSAVQIDKMPWYLDGNAMGSRVKAVDVTACGPEGHYWWIEIKDCDGHEADNQSRLTVEPPQEVKAAQSWIQGKGWGQLVEAKRARMFLADEVFQKIVGTMTSLSAACRAPATDIRAAAVQPHAAAFMPDAHWTVTLLLTWSGNDYRRLAGRLKTALEQRLHPFNVSCFVVNETLLAPAQPWTVRRTTPNKTGETLPA